MDMGGRVDARLHQRIKTLNNELRAAKANQRMRWRNQRKRDEGVPLHLGVM
jgi:predicted phage gp36 major capsid-like protein